MIKYSKEVATAKSQGRPIVALESTIISHGLPRPTNLEVALEVEDIVREQGATPATIAIIDGEIFVGLEYEQLYRIANDENIVKASTRDLAIVCADGKSAATTVAATSHIAHLADVEVFATGGLGGVSNPTAGSTNTGSGGGGSRDSTPSPYAGAAGGSGIVIIAYPDSSPAATLTNLTYTEPSRTGYRVYSITASSSGTITF